MKNPYKKPHKCRKRRHPRHRLPRQARKMLAEKRRKDAEARSQHLKGQLLLLQKEEVRLRQRHKKFERWDMPPMIPGFIGIVIVLCILKYTPQEYRIIVGAILSVALIAGLIWHLNFHNKKWKEYFQKLKEISDNQLALLDWYGKWFSKLPACMVRDFFFFLRSYSVNLSLWSY